MYIKGYSDIPQELRGTLEEIWYEYYTEDIESIPLCYEVVEDAYYQGALEMLRLLKPQEKKQINNE